MKRVKSVEVVTNVKQIIEVQDIASANALLSADWILLNTYYNAAFNSKKPTYVLGRVNNY